MSPQRITIVGLGLMGGSLAGACRKAFPRARIVGVTRNQKAQDAAKKRKWIHEGFTDLNQAFAPSPFPLPLKGDRVGVRGIVILCTPVDTLKNFLKRLDRIAPKGTLVTDAGSVKGFLVRWADRQKWKRIYFVGAHPMAGSHERGIGHARADLFKRALTFVTPGKKNKFTPLIMNFWKKISRRVVVIAPEKHDQVTAEISHLPHVVATLLVKTGSSESLSFAASGFLDTTRVAASHPDLWAPILAENRKELLKVLGRFETSLGVFKKALKKGPLSALKRVLGEARKRRLLLERKAQSG